MLMGTRGRKPYRAPAAVTGAIVPIGTRAAMVRRQIREDMDDTMALTRAKLLDQLVDFLQANKTLFFTRGGRVVETQEVADQAVRTWAWDKAMTLRGEYPAKNVQIAAHVTHVEELGPTLSRLESMLDSGEVVEAEVRQLAGLDPSTSPPLVIDPTTEEP